MKDNDFFSEPIKVIGLLANAITKRMIPSNTFVKNFTSDDEFTVKLLITDTDNKEETYEFPLSLVFDEKKGFRFKITVAQLLSIHAVFKAETYGLQKGLFFLKEENEYEVPENCVQGFSTKYARLPQQLEGIFLQLYKGRNENFENKYQRLLIPSDDIDFEGPEGTLESTGRIVFDHELLNITEGSIMPLRFRQGTGYTEVEFNNRKYHFYSINTKVLVIDSLQPENLVDFKNSCSIIRTALTLLSGKLYRRMVFHVCAASSDFSSLDGIYYEKEAESIITSNRMIDLHFFHEFHKYIQKGKENTIGHSGFLFPIGVFNKLCSILNEELEILRTAELIISGMNNEDPVQKGALYSVALETIANHLGKYKNNDVKPITDEKLSKVITEKMMDILQQYGEDIDPEKRAILEMNIKGINRPANADLLAKIFTLFEIKLTEGNKKAIKTRNDYLHGRRPGKLKEILDLKANACELHTLIVALIFKYSGYSGYLMNLHNKILFEDTKKRDELDAGVLDEIRELFKQGEMVIRNKDNGAAQQMKDKMLKLMDSLLLPQIVREI
jgi:hypothetical protein